MASQKNPWRVRKLQEQIGDVMLGAQVQCQVFGRESVKKKKETIQPLIEEHNLQSPVCGELTHR